MSFNNYSLRQVVEVARARVTVESRKTAAFIDRLTARNKGLEQFYAEREGRYVAPERQDVPARRWSGRKGPRRG